MLKLPNNANSPPYVDVIAGNTCRYQMFTRKGTLPVEYQNSACITVLEITVGHRTLSDQILKMSGQFHIMIGHDDRTSHQHILSYLLQGVVSQ